MLTVIRKRVYKSGFQKQGTNLEHLLNDEIKAKSGVVRTQVAIVFSAKGPSHGPCRKIAPGLSATLPLQEYGRVARHSTAIRQVTHFKFPSDIGEVSRCRTTIPHAL
jgi:hypothetical protein